MQCSALQCSVVQCSVCLTINSFKAKLFLPFLINKTVQCGAVQCTLYKDIAKGTLFSPECRLHTAKSTMNTKPEMQKEQISLSANYWYKGCRMQGWGGGGGGGGGTPQILLVGSKMKK